MIKFTRLIFLTALLTTLRLQAQVASPSPLTEPNASLAMVPGGWIAGELQANAALQAGFPRTAAAIYQEILLYPALPADARQRIILGRVTAWLDAGDTAEAERTLKSYEGPRNSDYQLRVGLIAVNFHRTQQAKSALAASNPGDLPRADRGWWYFLQGTIADADLLQAPPAEKKNEFEKRNKAYDEAARLAVSDLQRARFRLAQEQAQLRGSQLTEAQLKGWRDNMEKYQGTSSGYDALRTYAAGLAGVGHAFEAQSLLQRQLAILPQSERNVADQLRLVLGLVSSEESDARRQAFLQLLRNGQKPETQRLALQLLTHAAKTPAEREQLTRDLTELISAPTQSPIIEDLLLVRAQTELADKKDAAADEDARALLDRYPNSDLKGAALGVRLSVAWDLERYRTAADFIAKLRENIPQGTERSELGVLLAEAFFRAGLLTQDALAAKEDYRNAAYAYDAAMDERPAVVAMGKLIFQLVLSDIRADQLDAAVKQLDEAARNPAFDAESRWQAEWNLMKEMQIRGRTRDAYERVDHLLQGGTIGVPDDLRIRLMWMRAKLSFDNDQAKVTLQQTSELLLVLQSAPRMESGLLREVTGTTQLLRAQALLKLKREDEGFAVLEKLRTDFRGTKAAEYSYMVQADYLTEKGDMVGAQDALIKFVDDKDYATSEYAPLALYKAAVNLERQGLERQLREANKLLEDLIKKYPQDDLVFYARLKQGDLFRKLNDFASARQIYELLNNKYSQHPDILVAQLALADTLFAQGANPVNVESAATIFDRLRDLPSAPVDLRVEAGAMLGVALIKQSQTAGTPTERDQEIAKAQTVLWSVVNTFLRDPVQAAKLGATGRYWMSRSLLQLGQIHEDAGNLDEAQRAYQLIVDSKLGGSAQAREKLARYRLQVTAKP
ncbi:MAG TPA: tetratricopeptide repeat protein [Lacunisphaera sp.]|jgi:TolA-binding protein